jgi:hypothetical protein
MAEINMYMAMYYETRIKEEAERRVIIAERKFEQTTEEERAVQDLKKLVPVAIRNHTAVEFWKTESETTKEAVKARIEELYNEVLEAWNGKRNVPKTPQEYHQ